MRKLIALVALSLAVACGDSGTNPNTDDISGTYSVRTVNNSSVPYTFTSNGGSITLLSDVINVAGNGTWSETYTYRQGSQTTTGTGADAGTWSRSGANVTLYSTTYSETSYTGSYSNGQLMLNDGNNFNYVFQR